MSMTCRSFMTSMSCDHMSLILHPARTVDELEERIQREGFCPSVGRGGKCKQTSSGTKAFAC